MNLDIAGEYLYYVETMLCISLLMCVIIKSFNNKETNKNKLRAQIIINTMFLLGLIIVITNKLIKHYNWKLVLTMAFVDILSLLLLNMGLFNETEAKFRTNLYISIITTVYHIVSLVLCIIFTKISIYIYGFNTIYVLSICIYLCIYTIHDHNLTYGKIFNVILISTLIYGTLYYSYYFANTKNIIVQNPMKESTIFIDIMIIYEIVLLILYNLIIEKNIDPAVGVQELIKISLCGNNIKEEFDEESFEDDGSEEISISNSTSDTITK